MAASWLIQRICGLAMLTCIGDEGCLGLLVIVGNRNGGRQETLSKHPVGLCFEAGEVLAAIVGIGKPIPFYYAFKQGLIEDEQLMLVCL